VDRYVDFSANSKIYDRRHGAVISDQLVQAVANRVPRDATIIDIGAGTGRVSVALASYGFRAVAVDPAIPMLQGMQQKSGAARVAAVAAEGSRLPFRRDCADAVILARLLYLVADWQGMLREAMEVLGRGGVLFHEWGNGDASEAWVQVREKARSLFQEAGVESPFHPGARSEGAVDSCLRELGFLRKEQIAAGAGPVPHRVPPGRGLAQSPESPMDEVHAIPAGLHWPRSPGWAGVTLPWFSVNGICRRHPMETSWNI
jgi:SAM-dependent methyltransferase